MDSVSPAEASSSRPQIQSAFASSSGDRGAMAKVLIAAALAAIALVIAHALHGDRLRYREMAFGLYYKWWSAYDNGLDPWRMTPRCLYPPPFVIAFAPIARMNIVAAYWTWQGAQVVAFGAAIAIIVREAAPRNPVRIAAILALTAILLPYFFSSTLYEAEPSALLMLLLIAAWSLSRRERPAMAGLMLAVATVLKVYPVVVGGYFLFRRRYAVVIAGALWTLAIVALTNPLRWIGSLSHGAGPYFKTLAWASDGRAINIPLNAYAAMSALSIRPDAAVQWLAPIAVALDAAVVAIAAVITWRSSEASEPDGLALGIWMTAMLLVCPLTWNHEITLTLPIYLFAAASVMRGREGIAPAGASALILAAAGHALAYYSTPMRNCHVDFIAVLIGFAGACIMNYRLSRMAGQQPQHS